MNIADERPEISDRAKLLMAAGVMAAFAVLIVAFGWIMGAIRDHHLGQQVAMGATVAYVILVLAVANIVGRMWRVMSGRSWTFALARRQRRVMASAAIYAVILLAVTWLQKTHPVHGALAYGLAVLPAIPVVGMAVAMGLYFREENDEFERAVRIEQALWATGATLTIATVWGFAEMLADAPHVPNWIWFPVWALFTAVADFFIRRRYR
jgi:hypothetical protein